MRILRHKPGNGFPGIYIFGRNIVSKKKFHEWIEQPYANGKSKEGLKHTIQNHYNTTECFGFYIITLK